MIKFQLIFSKNDAIKLLQDAGLKVSNEEINEPFSLPHGSGEYSSRSRVALVQNPHTGEMEQVETVFRKYIKQRKKNLFLTADKLEIYNLFNTVKTTHDE